MRYIFTREGVLNSVTNIKKVLRNRRYLDAALLLKKPSEANFSQACGLLSEAIDGFNEKFKRIQAGTREPKNDLERLLVDIFRYDNKPPSSRKYLIELVEGVGRAICAVL